MKLLFLALVLAVTPGCAPESPPLSPLAPDALILAFGDSLTYGIGADPKESYPAQLEQLVSRRVINAGVPGEVTADGVERLREVLEGESPALLILCHGGNDLLRRVPDKAIESNLRNMIELARSQDIDVVLVGVPRPALLGLDAAPFYETLADEFGLPLEDDIVPDLEGGSDYKSDHIHFNAKGYEKMAAAIAQLMREAGAW